MKLKATFTFYRKGVMNIANLSLARLGGRGRIPGVALLALVLAAAPSCDDDEDVVAVGTGGTGGPRDGGDAAGGAGGSPSDGPTESVIEAGGEVSGETGGETASDAGTDAGQVIAVDTDLALVRFTANGMVDPTFGTAGIVKLDLSTAPGTATNNVRDSMWGLARDTTDRLVLFASKKAAAPRLDQDRVVVRLTPAGVKDATFGTAGEAVLDIMNLGDNPRNGFVQPDGKILSAGYTPQPTGVGAQVANKVVLQRLLDNGMPDPAFGTAGVVNSLPFPPPVPPVVELGMAEAYGAALQGDKYVTTGYGRSAPSGQVDMVSFRYTAAGVLDTTWGTNGIVSLDLIMLNDRGRNIIPLPDGRVVIAGTATRVTDTEDAMLAIYGANGAVDTTLGPMGYKLFEFGGTDEEFYGLALSPNNMTVAAAGYRVLAANDDDSTLVLLPLAAGGTAIQKTVALSETTNDRLWAVTFDANNKAVATGFVTEGTDNFMVVARFNADGTLDPTFGTGGFTKVNVSVGKTEENARGVVVQSDGKIVIAGVTEH
jgi:uncharacterized delta-60 repeat protein